MPVGELRWQLDHAVTLAFSTITDGDCRRLPERLALLARWGVPCPAVVPWQVHGRQVLQVDQAIDPPEADGLVSAAPLALGVFGADCPGLCIATPHALGMAHCGWRGTAGGIVGALVAALARLDGASADRRRWHAFIGPGIAAADYQVDAPVLSARSWPPAALLPSADPGHAQLDLASAITADLAQLGIHRVGRAESSTGRDPRLHSYRRQGQGLVQLLLAWRGAR